MTLDDERYPDHAIKNPFASIPFVSVKDSFIESALIRKEAWNIAQSFLRSDESVLAIIGQFGSGKSSFLLNIIREIKLNKNFLSIYVEHFKIHSKTEFYDNIVRQLELKEIQLKEKATEQDFEDLNNKIKGILADDKIILVLDDLIADDPSFDLLDLSKSLLRAGLFYKIILAVNIGHLKEVGKRLSVDTNLKTRVLPLLPLTVEETENLILYYLIEQSSKPESLNPFTEDAIVEIWRITEGNPRRILSLCHRLFSFSISEKASKIDAEFVRRFGQ